MGTQAYQCLQPHQFLDKTAIEYLHTTFTKILKLAEADQVKIHFQDREIKKEAASAYHQHSTYFNVNENDSWEVHSALGITSALNIFLGFAKTLEAR